MRIISWNCQMAFRKKAEAIIALNPDIVIIQESEHPHKLNQSTFYTNIKDSIWLGENPNKGLSILSLSSYKLDLLPIHSNEFRFVAPLRILGPIEFTMLAVWACHDKYLTYNGVIKFAVKRYWEALRDPCMVIGDWNANAIWDSKTGEGFSFNSNVLARQGMISAYHSWFSEAYGRETKPTYYHRKKEKDKFHIDYCYLSPALHSKLDSVAIGSFEDWQKLSDHMPLIIDFNLPS